MVQLYIFISKSKGLIILVQISRVFKLSGQQQLLSIDHIHISCYPRKWLNWLNSRYQGPFNRIGGVKVSMLASSVVVARTQGWLAKDYKIGICCFSANHTALRRKSKDWLALHHDNVSKLGDMSIRRLLSQWAKLYQNPTTSVGLVQSGPHHLIENYIADIAEELVSLALNNNHSLKVLLYYCLHLFHSIVCVPVYKFIK